VRLTPVVTTLREPIALALRPGDPDTLFVAERSGRIVAVVDGAVTATVLDMRKLTAPGGERGLLGFAYSPDAARLYTSYTDVNGDSTIDEYEVDGNGIAQVGSRRQVFFQKQPYSNHNGGNIVFGPDDMLYLGLGDGGSGGDPERHGQDLGSLLGKLIRIDPREASGAPYAVPADNPFITTAGARPEIYAYGLRNPWRYSFDAGTGDLWIGDVGQNAIEEVDHVAAAAGAGKGANFGWSAYEGSQRYNADQSAPNHTPPVREYEHGPLGCSITGGFLYRGTAIPRLTGAYVYADYCAAGIRAFDPADPAHEVKLTDQPGNVVSFGQGPTLELYVLSFDNTVYRLDPA
jgi:glucose/arabinose dehydrogenase